jgi:hypothetical protein
VILTKKKVFLQKKLTADIFIPTIIPNPIRLAVISGSSVTSITQTDRYKFCAAGWFFTTSKKSESDGHKLA